MLFKNVDIEINNFLNFNLATRLNKNIFWSFELKLK